MNTWRLAPLSPAWPISIAFDCLTLTEDCSSLISSVTPLSRSFSFLPLMNLSCTETTVKHSSSSSFPLFSELSFLLLRHFFFSRRTQTLDQSSSICSMELNRLEQRFYDPQRDPLIEVLHCQAMIERKSTEIDETSPRVLKYKSPSFL